MYAIIEDSGTQFKVAKGDRFDIDVRDANPDDVITFDKVLAIGNGDGNARIGQPYVGGATVTAKVLDRKRGEKIDVIKFRRRKGYRRKTGHRQSLLTVEITEING